MSEAATTGSGTPRPRRSIGRAAAILIGGFALFAWLAGGGPPSPDPTLPPVSSAPTPRSAAEGEQATGLLSQIISAAGLGVVLTGPDVRPPLPIDLYDLPRIVVRGASALDPSGMPLVAILCTDAGSAAMAAERIAASLATPGNLVLVPPDARFTVRRSGSTVIIFQRTPSGDPDPAAADLLEATLNAFGEAVPIPR
ncbi:MAG: hypothetical protein RIQ87_906 [Chloroflexota bacterium]|jgi:hypothetical protein